MFVFTQSSRHGLDVTRSNFMWSTVSLILEVSLSKISCLTKAEEPNLPNYLSIAVGRTVGFQHFPTASKIRTQVTDSISDDKHYTKRVSTI